MLDSLTDKLVAKLVAVLVPILVEKVSALLPLVAAAAARAVADQLKVHLPDLGQLPQLPDLAEKVRQQINLIPDVDVPVLSALFDLSEWLKR
jgi:hypothetical protein